ncbi:hypothetical protein, partial [Enterovibrio nigricans]
QHLTFFMFNVLFNVLLSKGFDTMFKLNKGAWATIAVAVTIMVVVMAVVANVDALEKPRKSLGLDKGSL